MVAALGMTAWAFTLVHDNQQTSARLALEAGRARRLQDAQGTLAVELPRLLALGTFSYPLPPTLEMQQGIAASLQTTFRRDQLLDQLATANTQVLKAMRDVERSGLRPPAEAEQAFTPLGPALRKLRAGHTPHLDAHAYQSAWTWIVDRAQREQSSGAEAAQRLAARAQESPPLIEDPRLLGAIAVVLSVSLLGATAASRVARSDLSRASEEREAERSRADRFASLFATARGFATIGDPLVLATTLTEHARRVTGADLAVLAEVVGAELVPLAALGCEPARVPVGTGLAGRAIDAAIVTSTTTTVEPLLGSTNFPFTLEVTAAPLVSAGRVVAVLVVANPDRGTRDAEREQVLSLLALCAAPALESARAHGRTLELAHIDELTGLFNKRRLGNDLPATLIDAATDHRAVSVMMIDVDHFKSYNDEYGHPAGDEALRRVAGIVRASVRERDTVYRFGGEELAVLLPATPLAEALAVAERVRAAVALDGGPAGRRGITVSIGAAETSGSVDGPALLAAADSALYAAKDAGRNQVVAAPRRDASSAGGDPGEFDTSPADARPGA